MKLALVTEDGVTICQHFGFAPYYMVVTAENGKIVAKEQRAKAGHHTAGAHDCHDASCHDAKHGMDAASQVKHAGMLANIKDCQVIIAGGMGWGAYESMKQNNIEPIITDEENIDDAVNAYLNGKLVNLREKLH